MRNAEKIALCAISGMLAVSIGVGVAAEAEIRRIDKAGEVVFAAAASEASAPADKPREERLGEPEKTEPEPIKAVPEEPDAPPEKESLGVFTVTAYCGCEACCGKWADEKATTASGTYAQEGRTVGADWETIPPGTQIEIEKVGLRTVEDKPAEWVVEKWDGKILDLYFQSHEEALNFGVEKLEVWIGA